MAIARKPKSINHVNAVDLLINKGGSVSGENKLKQKSDDKKLNPITLRLPNSLIDQIEEILLKKIIRKPRHTWILEAILEKIDKEQI